MRGDEEVDEENQEDEKDDDEDKKEREDEQGGWRVRSRMMRVRRGSEISRSSSERMYRCDRCTTGRQGPSGQAGGESAAATRRRHSRT